MINRQIHVIHEIQVVQAIRCCIDLPLLTQRNLGSRFGLYVLKRRFALSFRRTTH